MKSFCISLEKKKETWPALEAYFSENGIDKISFFPGVNGKEIGEYYKNTNTKNISENTLSLITSLGGVEKMVSTWGLYNLSNMKTRKDHAQLSSWGAVGCSLSHILLWKKIVDENLDSLLIFEDDIYFYPNFKENLSRVLENIPEDADAVFLDVIRNFKSVQYNDIFDRILDQFFGMHAYIMTNKGAKKLLPYVFPIEIQIDSFMGFRANLGDLTLFAAKDICGQKVHISTIQTINPCVLCDLNDKHLYFLNFTFGFLVLFSFILVFVILYFLWKKT